MCVDLYRVKVGMLTIIPEKRLEPNCMIRKELIDSTFIHHNLGVVIHQCKTCDIPDEDLMPSMLSLYLYLEQPVGVPGISLHVVLCSE